MKTIQRSIVRLFAALLATFFISPSYATPYLKGDVKLQSIGPLSPGPDGVLFISDPKAASIISIMTTAKPADNPSGNFKVEGLNGKVAAVLGASVDQVRIIDLAVDTSSKLAYSSVIWGQGPNSDAVVVSVRPSGKDGDSRVVIGTGLEDLAGNSVTRPFEVDRVQRPDDEFIPDYVTLEFKIGN